MPKKKKTAKSRKQAAAKQSPEEYHLMALIRLTDRARTNDESELDLYFKKQSDRLRDRLEALKVK